LHKFYRNEKRFNTIGDAGGILLPRYAFEVVASDSFANREGDRYTLGLCKYNIRVWRVDAMKEEKERQNNFWAQCREKLQEIINGKPPGVGGWIAVIVVVFFYWFLTTETFFAEKNGLLWFIYRYLPSPLNKVLLWELIGPPLVGLAHYRLYLYLEDKKNAMINAIKQELESSPNSEELRKKVERKAKVTLVIGITLFPLLMFILRFITPSVFSPYPGIIDRLLPPFSNGFVWLWIIVVGAITLEKYFEGLKTALGEENQQESLKNSTSEEQQEVNMGRKQIFSFLKGKLLRKSKGDEDKDKQDEV